MGELFVISKIRSRWGLTKRKLELIRPNRLSNYQKVIQKLVGSKKNKGSTCVENWEQIKIWLTGNLLSLKTIDPETNISLSLRKSFNNIQNFLSFSQQSWDFLNQSYSQFTVCESAKTVALRGQLMLTMLLLLITHWHFCFNWAAFLELNSIFNFLQAKARLCKSFQESLFGT